MASHRLRVRHCGDCANGHHDVDRDGWRTDYLLLVRQRCACADCDCTFHRVFVRQPCVSQRHHQPGIVGRKRRTGARHAA